MDCTWSDACVCACVCVLAPGWLAQLAVKRDWRDVGVVISPNSSRAEDVLSSVPRDIRDRSEEIRRPNISGEFQQEGMKIAGQRRSLFAYLWECHTWPISTQSHFTLFIVLLPTFSSFGGQRVFFSTLCGCFSRPLNQHNLVNRSCVCMISQSYPVMLQSSVCAGLFEVFAFSSAGLFLLAGRYVHLTLMASLAISQRIFQTTCF